mgnify:FL=1
MSTVNRWSKMAGLLNEAAEPQSQEQEVHESTQELAVSENIMNADKLRSLISEIANEILNEARASNSDVELIQMALKGINQGDSAKANELGLQGKIGNIVADGMFGKNTKAAVEKFQTAAGLSSDGIVGPGTLNALLGMFETGVDKEEAYNAQVQNLVDRKIVARLGSGIGKKSSKPAAPEAPEAPVKKRKALTVADAEEPSEGEEDELADFLDDLGEDMTDEERSASAEATAYAALQKVGAGDPGDEEDLDMTISALLPGVSGYGADAWTRGVEVTDQTTGQKVTVISQQDWELAGGPNLGDDVEVGEDPNLGK